jgi:superfamily I DNA/RNA helicase
MIEVQIAGAGSGKTYGLAKTLADKYEKLTNDKIIYALTYTNAATQKINIELIKILGEIPSSIKVETVHSFLLNEVIYPFSPFITGDIYNNTSTTPLPNKQAWKTSAIARLKAVNVVHAENVYAVSRKILDSTHSNNNSKAKKAKVVKVISILKSSIDSIYIDEVQDLNLDALDSFKSLGLSGIYLYMIGDPKQAIKYPKILSNFISNLKKESSDAVNILNVNNETRRVPSEILELSNKFCYQGQSQVSLSKIVGTLTYIESSANEFEEFLTQHVSSDSIVCIDQKNKKYSTNKNIRFSFDPKIQKKIAISNHGQDDELVVKSAYTEFARQVNSHNEKFAVYALVKKFDLNLEKQEYGILFSLAEQLLKVPAQYIVSSIDSVKGLDADDCIIILTNTIYNYLKQTDLKEENKFNKIWKQVYVALTRAKKNVIIVLDVDIFSINKIKEIKTELENLGFIPHSSFYNCCD